eukprot:COSAG06_NODE_7988_length_2310_cov_6.644957_2_plen_75_part_00
MKNKVKSIALLRPSLSSSSPSDCGSCQRQAHALQSSPSSSTAIGFWKAITAAAELLAAPSLLAAAAASASACRN